ncbi:TorF family putative porin [Pseudomonas sp. SO81]|uniref:TorF family putative porin n=1 Tax=Pseudomonas sp. SO81 TaxID=2983246 RepID=UPI0025A405BA|nr:TorF family putative porin [Pseudomonas sp. SO81]WJN58207.1 hypothetical protein OH686_05640 [Pseudomonas sp. SO81]
MKRHLSLALAAALLAPAVQAIELTRDLGLELNAGIYSDYRTRGISQTQNDPALQGSATLLHGSGLYAGVWGSNVDFGHGSSTRQEQDYYAGYYWQIDDDIALDLSYIEYVYPRQSEFNYGEYQVELSAYGAFLGGKYSNDMAGDQSYLYSYLGYRATLPWELGLELRYGQADYKDPVFLSASGDDRDSYQEWESKLSRSLLGLDWSLSYVDTDLSEAECAGYYGFEDVCSATVVAGVSKTF